MNEKRASSDRSSDPNHGAVEQHVRRYADFRIMRSGTRTDSQDSLICRGFEEVWLGSYCA